MFRKTILAATVLATLAGGTATAMAQDMPPPPPPGGEMHGGFHGRGMHGGMMFLAGLKLTPAQHKQLRAIFEGVRKDHKAYRADGQQRRALRQQIEDTLMAPGPVDRAKLTALTQQIDALRQKGEAERLDIAVKIHDILTPAQLAQAKARQDRIRALQEQMHQAMMPDQDDSGK
ncbi:Spy/CpxP family protein refolding chaperone [Gluconacetobacter azotocaptans]|uniref:Spy/CpxP family protein refolding chaperone n=1 Tax=Gluconacetobacter azotocaptans TaxID=142834 RepID=UPI00195BCE97|nr:Spy/CpxP family protein refolding chaperone [Gluconacetobacter azotocaptans]MBM9402986.1 Spy/CpxP family protein refolding chaperone [Gluconacetobacter azotocaptans]